MIVIEFTIKAEQLWPGEPFVTEDYGDRGKYVENMDGVDTGGKLLFLGDDHTVRTISPERLVKVKRNLEYKEFFVITERGCDDGCNLGCGCSWEKHTFVCCAEKNKEKRIEVLTEDPWSTVRVLEALGWTHCEELDSTKTC